MITEDYVTREVAQKLKSKGFDERCHAKYTREGLFRVEQQRNYFNREQFSVACPTLQMAMKWLREVHHLHIVINPSGDIEGNFGYVPLIYGILDKECICGLEFVPLVETDNIVYCTPKTYEEAANAAILYALENLM